MSWNRSARMKFIFVASFYGQQNFKHCNTFCFACSLTLVKLQPSVCREQNGGQSRLWVLFLSRGDSEELTWQSLDLTALELGQHLLSSSVMIVFLSMTFKFTTSWLSNTEANMTEANCFHTIFHLYSSTLNCKQLSRSEFAIGWSDRGPPSDSDNIFQMFPCQ